MRPTIERRKLPATFRAWCELNAPSDIRDDVLNATAARGKRAGRLLKSAPYSKGPRAIGAWRAIMMEVAPVRAGIYSIAWGGDDEQSASYKRVSAWFRNDPCASIVARLAGGGFCEFSMDHFHLDDAVAFDWARDVAKVSPAAIGVLEVDRRAGGR